MALFALVGPPLQALGVILFAALLLYFCRRMQAEGRRVARRSAMAGQVAIVTGGSSGIGLAIAQRLGAGGMKLVLAARREEQLKAAAQTLRASGVEVVTIPTDITDASACAELVAETLKIHGRLDLLVASAGVGHHGFAHMDSTQVQRRLMEVNHFGTINTLSAALPALHKYGGELLVLSSMSGIVGSPLRSAYCASKYATIGYIESLRLELMMLGTPLRMTLCLPGSVNTPFRKHNIGPRPKMSADKCADIAVAGWERGDFRVYAPTHASLLILVPTLFGRWILDAFMKKNQKMMLQCFCDHTGAKVQAVHN